MSKNLLRAPSADALQLAQALGLPPKTTAFSLSVRCGEAAVVEAECYAPADGASQLATVLKRFQLVEATAAPMAELLHWHRVADVMPDADITVLMWTRGQDGTHDWCSGWWDGEVWRDNSGWPLEAEEHQTVTHWAQPDGPQE